MSNRCWKMSAKDRTDLSDLYGRTGDCMTRVEGILPQEIQRGKHSPTHVRSVREATIYFFKIYFAFVTIMKYSGDDNKNI